MSDFEDTASQASADSLNIEDFEISDDDEALFAADDSQQRKKTGKRSSVRIPLATCHLCKQGFFSLETYSAHLKMHVVQDLYSNGPGPQAMLQHCRESSRRVLEEIQACPLSCGLSTEVKAIANNFLEMADHVLWIFVDCMAEHAISCLPPASSITLATLNFHFLKKSNSVLNDLSVRKDMLQVAEDILTTKYSNEVLNLFINAFFSRLCTSVEVFYLKSIKEPHEVLLYECGHSEVRRGDDLEDINFQQSVHYIGGSCVKSVLRMGLKYPNNEKWMRIVNCLKCRLLVGPLVDGPGCEIEAWTESRDRGGLKFITEGVWSLLMAISGLLKELEEPDGSVKQDTVFSRVQGEAILMQFWKDIVGDSLGEQDSMFLLQHLCTKYVNAWGRGVALRHKNAIYQGTKGKVALRSRLSK